MNALNTILMNMTSMDNMESAVKDAASSKSSDKFKMLLNAQNNQSGKAEAKETNTKELLMTHYLAKDAEIAGEEETEDSKCFDTELQTLMDGIVGILEGFGLLNYDMDEAALEKLSEELSQLIGSDTQDMNQKLSQLIARMPNSIQDETSKQDLSMMVQNLIEEYQCSFENTNNKGVKDADLLKESAKADKLGAMLKQAISNLKNAEEKQVGKEMNNSDSENGQEGAMNGNSQVFKMNASENSNNTEAALSESEAEGVSQAMDENIESITEKITASQSEGKKEFDVTLKPDFLGKLSIKLIMEGDGIRAQIKAADQYVKGLIMDQLPELSEQLKQKGINMANIEVVYDSPDYTSFEGQFQQHNSNMSGNSSKNLRSIYSNDIDAVDPATYEAMLDYTDLSLMNSSVEFSA